MTSRSRIRGAARRAALLTLLCTCGTWLLHDPGRALAEAPPPDELPRVDQLGADTVSYLYRMSWDELRPRLAGTPALEAIEHPEVEAFFDEIRRVGQRHRELAALYRFVLSALHQDLVIAAADLDEESREESPEAPDHYVAIARGESDGEPKFRAKFDEMIETISEWVGEVNSEEIGGLKFHVLGDLEDGIFTAWKDDRCYWTGGAASARWVTGPPRGGKLGDSPVFRAGVGPLLEGQSSKPIAMYYHDLRPGWRRLTAHPQQAMAWSQLSWRSLDTVAGATFIEDGHYRNRHYWKVSEDFRTGLFRFSEESRVDPEWLRRVPAEASGFTTGVWDPQSMVLSLIGLMGKVTGQSEQMIAAAPMALAPMAPLLTHVGPRYMVYRLPGRYGDFPLSNVMPLSDLVVVAELTGAGPFKQNLDQLLKMVPTAGETTTPAGHTVKTLNVMYFSLYIAILEDVVIVTSHPQLMKDALDNWQKPGPSIVDTPAYKAAAKHIVPDACFLLYIAPGGFSRGIYDQYIPALQQMLGLWQATVGGFDGHDDRDMRPEARGLDTFLFPRGSAFSSHVKTPTILSAHDTGEGVLFDGRAPVLCTPYYWVYVHALTRLYLTQEAGGLLPLLEFLVAPLDIDEEAPATRREIEPEAPSEPAGARVE